jgi:hypothetical protein
MNNWQKVFETENNIRASMVSDLLKEKGLNPIIVNKKDSSLNNFGQIEILVPPEDVLHALKLINEDLNFE